MAEKTIIMDQNAMNRAIARISHEIIEHNKGIEDLCIIGMLSRGVHLAYRIAEKIYEVEGSKIDVGQLDITCFRDDKKAISHTDLSRIEFNIKHKRVVLVDDVIYTGRSVRAAIEAIMSRGRPQQISLAVLIDRGHRELPIRADFIGKNVPTSHEEKVKVMLSEIDNEDRVIILDENGVVK